MVPPPRPVQEPPSMRLATSPLAADELLRMIQVLPDVIFRCEKRADGKIYWTFNEGKLAEEFHLTTREIEGKSLDELFPGGASDAMREHFEAAFRGEAIEFVNEIGGRYFKHFPQPIFDAQGNVTHVVGFISEVTSLQRAQMEIQKLTEELARRLIDLSTANEELEAFNYTLSHDLRTPLTVIATQSHLIEQEAASGETEKVAERANRIHKGVRRMDSLMESVLALSRASRKELAAEAVDLSLLASQIVEEHRAAEPDRVVELDIGTGITAHGDGKLLHQVLANLLGNAWKYTRKAEHPHITFGERWDDDEHIYYVRDNGAGFDMAHAGWLFQPFKRLHSGKDFEGTGIGLATVHKIVTRHGGRIWAHGRPGEGATFYFTLAKPHPRP